MLMSAVTHAFDVRSVVIGPNSERAYDEAEWRDAIVLIERGEIELECRAGGRRRFRRGHSLWLTGLSLRTIRNSGWEPAVLIAISRRAGG